MHSSSRTTSLPLVLQITRFGEYYGSIFFDTALGLLISGVRSLSTIIVLTVANLSLVAFSFTFNDIEDADEDAQDNQKANRNPISARIISASTGYIISSSFAGASLLFYGLLGLYPFLLGVIGISLSFIYSWRLIRLKSKPIVDLFTHGLHLGTLQFLCAVSLGDPRHMKGITLIAIMIFLLSTMADINNEIRDYDIDRVVGLNNTLSLVSLRWAYSYLPYFCSLILVTTLLYIYKFLTAIGKYALITIFVIAIASYLRSIFKHKQEIFDDWRTQLFGFSLGLALLIFRN